MTSSLSPRMTGPEEYLVVWGAALLLSLLAGAMAAHVELIWVAAAVGAILAVAMAASRVATLWFVVISGLVLIGLAQLYVPGAKYLKYLPPLAAAGLLLHVAAEWLSYRRTEVPATVRAFLCFFLISVVSIAVNWQSVGMTVIGVKSYYLMWPLFLGLALISWRPGVVDSLPKAMVAIAILQLPSVAHQFLLLVPLRELAHLPGVVSVDIVAGTFGGSLFAGGANAVLSVFLITVCACLLGIWRQGALSGAAAIGGILVLLIPVMLNGSRVALLYLPIVFITIFHTEIARQPLKAFTGAILTVSLVAVMLASFTMLSQSPNTRSWQGLLEETYQRQLASEQERSDVYSGLSRWTALTFWVEKHQQMDPVQILIGHGPGATRVQEEGLDLAKTLAEQKYGGLQIGYTAVSALLWEVGVLGLLAVLWIFWEAFRQAGRLAEHFADTDRVKSGIAYGLQASIVMLVLSLAHKDFFVFHVPYQTFVVLVLGYLAAQTNLMAQTQAQIEPAR